MPLGLFPCPYLGGFCRNTSDGGGGGGLREAFIVWPVTNSCLESEIKGKLIKEGRSVV